MTDWDANKELEEWQARCMGGPTGWWLSAMVLAVLVLGWVASIV